MKYYDKLIFELSSPGRCGYSLPENRWGTSTDGLPDRLRRKDAPALPQVSEPDVVRHYTNLSQMNFGVDSGFYPLGSWEWTAQGALKLYYDLSRALSTLTGMAEFSLNQFAGAHGELTGLMIMRQYHRLRGDDRRTRVIVPDSAHGTNPASAAVCGLSVVQVRSLEDGTIDVEALKGLLDDTVAGIMMTNPNTLGLFETHVKEIAELVHGCGGLLYYDGANMNALLGQVRPGDMGFDIMHLNLHKTFSTPHGGGGPGAGPVGVVPALAHCLPYPRVIRRPDGRYALMTDKDSCGRISGFMGNFGVLLKAYAYILMLGKQNVRNVGPYAVLAANYIKESLKDCYKLPVKGLCKHEFVFDGLADTSSGVTTLDVAKRLLDYGFHAPTIYFPLLFHQSMMIEPTETESKETLDAFIGVMRKIAEEAKSDPELLRSAPHNTPVGRPDETAAATHPVLKYEDM